MQSLQYLYIYAITTDLIVLTMYKIAVNFIIILILSSCSEDVSAFGQTQTLPAEYSKTLPVIFIETENRVPVTSTTRYLSAQFWLDPMEHNEIKPVGSKAQPVAIQIKGRGHSSWQGPKKPYKLKLNTKISLMGMPKNKHWALLKPSENTVAGLQLGKIMGMAWTPDFRPVEVILNGDYIGLYFLTETIRIDKNRVNIYEQPDNETNPDLITGGWLVEIDNYRDECQISIPENNNWNLTIRYHSPENLSSIQLQWLIEEFKKINSAIYSSDKTSTTWEKYIDVESIARYFIIQEIMDNPDGFHGSFYLHKDLAENSKWIAGPIWDLVCYNREKTDYTFKMKVHYSFTPHWIGEIIQYDNFCKAVNDIWNNVYPEKISEIYHSIDVSIMALDSAWRHDAKRWNEDSIQTAEFRADRIKSAIRRNINWFNNHLPGSPHSSLSSLTRSYDNSTKVYNLQGHLVGEFENENAAVSHLEKGLYIINKTKVIIQ